MADNDSMTLSSVIMPAKEGQCPTGEPKHWIVPQQWDRYSDAEHEVWRTLYLRQTKLLPGHACDQFLQGLGVLGLEPDHIPDFEELSARLNDLTGWSIVPVEGLIPDPVFFNHLANRRFPAGAFIRRRDQLDYIQEPDVFHDVYGHAPLLTDPVFADYLQAYGRGGLRALGCHALPNLARLYWYTVEFGLIETRDGLRTYGAGILSSFKETRYALNSTAPRRVLFNLERIVRTLYRIDNLQQTYFVIRSFDELFDATLADFGSLYDRLHGLSDIEPDGVIPTDQVYPLMAAAL
jgi:phenylalanine-4-hydroxylase